MTISAVATQQVGSTFDATATATKAFTANVTSGNLIIVTSTRALLGNTAYVAGDCTKNAGTATIGTVSLLKANNADVGGSNFLQCGLWGALVTGNGSLTMQVAEGGSGVYSTISIGEFSTTLTWDMATILEASNSNQSATDGQTSWDSGNGSSAGGALFLGVVTQDGSTNISMVKDAAFTQIYNESDVSLHNAGLSQYRIVSSGTTDSNSGTMTSDSIGWVAALAVLKEVGGASSFNPTPIVDYYTKLIARRAF